MFPLAIDDPNLKSSTKDRISQCARSVRLILQYIFLDSTLRTTLKAKRRTWRKTQMQFAQLQKMNQGSREET
jgi:ribosomal protein L39E